MQEANKAGHEFMMAESEGAANESDVRAPWPITNTIPVHKRTRIRPKFHTKQHTLRCERKC
jgi:hypothetical protein